MKKHAPLFMHLLLSALIALCLTSFMALPARFDGETNLWPLLEHDPQYFKGTAWATHSSGLVKSVTFAVEPGDRICATSFGKAGENGHASSNGIRLTFFDAWGVAQTLTPAETYAAFAANGGYIPAPEGAVAVNVPLWADDESAVVRIINAVHIHEWSAWTEVTAPTCATEGQDMRYCFFCHETEYRDTRITGDPDKILVSDPLPEDYFTGKNIVLIGDSITAGVGTTKRYGEYLAEILGLNFTHKGSSGTGYCSGGAMATNQNLTESNIRNADIISIMLGVNDWNWAVKDGSWNGKPGYYDESQTYYQLGNFDSTDTSTFYGALHSWCHNILGLQQMEGFEDKQFIVITPMITSWNISLGEKDWDQDKQNIHGHTFREYCTAIMEVCAYYEIPVFDANMFSGVYYHSETDNNIAETGGDGVHVNAAGHALLAQALAEFLLDGYTYETRSVPKGGHSFSDGVCTACRLPGTALDVCGASDHDWGAWEFSWFGPDHLLTAERVCDNNTTHRDTETADTPEDALALLRGLLGNSFRWLVTASYDAAGRMEQILMTNAAEAFDAERFIRFANAVDVRFFYLDQSFTPIC